MWGAVISAAKSRTASAAEHAEVHPLDFYQPTTANEHARSGDLVSIMDASFTSLEPQSSQHG